MSIWSK